MVLQEGCTSVPMSVDTWLHTHERGCFASAVQMSPETSVDSCDLGPSEEDGVRKKSPAAKLTSYDGAASDRACSEDPWQEREAC